MNQFMAHMQHGPQAAFTALFGLPAPKIDGGGSTPAASHQPSFPILPPSAGHLQPTIATTPSTVTSMGIPPSIPAGVAPPSGFVSYIASRLTPLQDTF